MAEVLDHTTVVHGMQPEETPELQELYQGFAAQSLLPLWTQLGDLMPIHPRPKAVPHVWQWSKLLPLAERSGELVPVGRGGERRAIGLGNPGLAPHSVDGEDTKMQHSIRYVLLATMAWASPLMSNRSISVSV